MMFRAGRVPAGGHRCPRRRARRLNQGSWSIASVPICFTRTIIASPTKCAHSWRARRRWSAGSSSMRAQQQIWTTSRRGPFAICSMIWRSKGWAWSSHVSVRIFGPTWTGTVSRRARRDADLRDTSRSHRRGPQWRAPDTRRAMRGAGFNQGGVCAGMKHPGSARSHQGLPRWCISIQGFETRLAFPPAAQHAERRYRDEPSSEAPLFGYHSVSPLHWAWNVSCALLITATIGRWSHQSFRSLSAGLQVTRASSTIAATAIATRDPAAAPAKNRPPSARHHGIFRAN